MKTAAFFGGALPTKDTQEYEDSVKIGEILAKKGYIVKNGGYYGLMEAVSIGSGNAIGYVCESFKSTEGNPYLAEKVVCADIYDRLRLLIEDTSLFIVQKGGLGTLAELFLCLDLMRKRKKKRPVILIGSFWWEIIFPIRELLNMGEEELITIIDSIDELNELI